MSDTTAPLTHADVAEPARPGSGARQLLAIVAAGALCVPGIALKLSGAHPATLVAAFVYGFAIVGAAFLLAWAGEVVQLDVSQGLALALIALIAVLPEYAVDFVFAWKAGKNPAEYAPLALANMTGSNRLLIGVGWSMVVFLAAWRMHRIARRKKYTGPLDTDIALERSHAIEIAFLAAATLYSLSLPFKHTLTLIDAGILVLLYGLYVARLAKAPAEEPDFVGPPQLLARLAPLRRRLVVAALLLYAAGAIVLCAERFAESLVQTGESFGVSTFLLVQWVAPLASEAPELLVAGLFAWRLNTNAGLGTLISSKVNQWTLLVGTLPIVFAISSGALHGLPLDALQREELFLTAAQSAFAVAVLSNRKFSVREGAMLLGLFLSQFAIGAVVPESWRAAERYGVGVVYLVLAAIVIISKYKAVGRVLNDGFRVPVRELVHDDEAPAFTGERP
ncbi:MAG: sodium:proton exchanger [Acidimicrobiia bacterium]